jgi:hypothetical protein
MKEMNVKNIQLCFLTLILFLLVLAAPIMAHHGTNISYDHDKPTTLKGVVTEFVWSNPHCQLYFDVKDANGKVINWGGELNSPSVLRREGWTRKEFMPGEQITVTVFPSKAGAAVGVVDRTHAIIVNGQERVKANSRNVD